MFAYYKQGLVLKKHEKKEQENIQYCSMPNHLENQLNLICFDELCQKKGLICSECYFKDHLKHFEKCSTLKQFLHSYKLMFLDAKKNNNNNEDLENEINKIKTNYATINEEIKKSKNKLLELFSLLEEKIIENENKTIDKLKKKNFSEIEEILNNLENNIYNDPKELNESINIILEKIDIKNTINNIQNENIKQKEVDKENIISNNNLINNSFKREIINFQSTFNYGFEYLNNIIDDKKVEFYNSILNSENSKKLSELLTINLKFSNVVRVFNSFQEGFEKKIIEKKCELKNNLLFLIKNNFEEEFGFFSECGLPNEENYDKNMKYIIFSLTKNEKIKESRHWGRCFCLNKCFLTSSNIHEIILYDNCNILNINEVDSKISKNNNFRVEKLEIFMII